MFRSKKLDAILSAFKDHREQIDEAIVALSKKVEKLGNTIIDLHDTISEKDAQIKELRQEIKERVQFSEKLLLLVLHNQKEEAEKKAAEPPKKSVLELYLENKKANGSDTAGPKGKLP